MINIPLSRTPNSLKIKQLPEAPMANVETSVELVSSQEYDAFYFRALEQNQIRLNRAQIEAVRHGEGPLLTLAGAGSGKTSVLVSRTGYLLVVRRIPPRNILLLTFTTKAANEMKERIAKLPGMSWSQVKQITTGTFHSFFLRMLRDQGYQQKILSNEKYKQTILKIILKELGYQEAYQPETLLALFSFYKGRMKKPQDLLIQTEIEKEIQTIFTRYEEWKRHEHLLDFDDILMEAYTLFKKNPVHLQHIQETYQYVMVDEFQDTNPIQYELVRMVSIPQNHIMVVGDDDQTIYSFNGADHSLILNFNDHYPNVKTITLDVNYRSTTAIVGLGNEIIRHNLNRHVKSLAATTQNSQGPYFMRPTTTDEEAEWIVQLIHDQVKEGKTFRDFSILYRTTTSSRAMMEQLILDELPFISYSSGEVFYEQATVKPLIDYMRLSLHPKDYAALEGIIPSLYMNKDMAMEWALKKEMTKPEPSLLFHLLSMPGLKPYQRENLRKKIQLITEVKTQKPQDVVKSLRTSYEKYLDANERQNLTLHKEIIKETLDELESSAKRFQSVIDFLNFIDHVIETNKKMEEHRKNPDVDAVSLMTIHKSKGLEFDTVFLIGMSEGILPHSSALEASGREDLIHVKEGQEKVEAAIEEERRLAYVGVTRAKQSLFVSSPSLYRGKKADVSRFLIEAFSTPQEQKQVKTAPLVKSKDKMTVHEDLLAWVCHNQTCNTWMRITNYLEKSKYCPLCGFPMKKERKQIVIQV
ncbi:UvrD-helicase domain-containing protein [Ammoniphilus sp. 3BR4]|uniref:UvrD-helicase domain-containing protein n=1 Tax=Ammoniphilus sp. 3BR4 TaxID=3158265 RepID=UPI003465981A